MPELKLSVLIPVRNEGVNIKIMLKMLKAALDLPHEVLIIYDEPSDDDIPVVKSMQHEYSSARLIYNNLGKGVANAIKAGVAASEGDRILIFAVDEAGPVFAIEDMLALMDEGCELVSCTRYAYGGKRLGGSFLGGIISKMANNLFRVFSGTSLTDVTTGIKMIRKRFFDKLTIESNPVGWAVVFEMAIKAELAGVKMGEVPIVSIDRLYGGTSTFLLGPWFKEYLRWFFWGIKNLRGLKSRQKTIVKIPKNMAAAMRYRLW